MRPSRRVMQWTAAPIGIALLLVLAGCTQQEAQGFLPGSAEVTNHTGRIIGLWTTSWIVLLVVGLVTWALILWAAIVYRRRRGQTGMPVQMRYNLPIEILYTIVPFILVIGFFAFTARDQTEIEAPIADPDVTISVFGKQWSWDFNYVQEDVHEEAGVQAQFRADGQLDGQDVPTLWLPVDRTVEIILDSRDVIHSFWVIDFLYKKDLFPGHTNRMYFTPTKVGEYLGKCAELCGEYHSQMLFKVKVVPLEEFEAHIEELRAAGNEGQLGADLDRNQNFPNEGVHSVDEGAEG